MSDAAETHLLLEQRLAHDPQGQERAALIAQLEALHASVVARRRGLHTRHFQTQLTAAQDAITAALQAVRQIRP